MKNVLLVIFLLLRFQTMANVSKVYIAVESDALSTTPIHGSGSWASYIGVSKLAFATGYSYKMKIEYSGIIPPGTIKASNSSASISNVIQSGATFTFNVTIPALSSRLSTFQIGYNKGGSTLSFIIPCEVVEIGTLFSMTVKDTTNTMMVSYAVKTDQLTSMIFIKNTGNKYFTFYGSNLQNLKFNYSSGSGQASGLIFNSGSFLAGNSTQFSLHASVTATPVSGGKLTTDVLWRLIDNAADKHYPWVTYRYAKRMTGGTGNQMLSTSSGSGTLSTGTLLFEVLPGQQTNLPEGTSGFHDFLSAGYNIN